MLFINDDDSSINDLINPSSAATTSTNTTFFLLQHDQTHSFAEVPGNKMERWSRWLRRAGRNSFTMDEEEPWRKKQKVFFFFLIFS